MTRRSFLGGLSASLGAATCVDLAAWPPAFARGGQHGTDRHRLRIDARKLRERIETLSTFGRPTGGRFADGVSRIAYSDADVAGRAYVMAQMRAAGLQPRIDPAGNIFARRDGTVATLPPILFGSHIDS